MTLWPSRAYITHLEAEVAWLRMRLVHQEQRGDRAMDALAMVKVGVGPITVPTPEERKEQEREVDALLGDPEFTNAGQTA